MAGEDRLETDAAVPSDRFLYNKPPYVRAAISLAGPAANVLLAFVVTLAVGAALALPVLQVADVVPDSPAAAVLEPGDRVVAVNGRPIYTHDDLTAVIAGSEGRPVEFLIVRRGETRTVDVAPRDTEGEGFKVGAYFRASAPTTEIVGLSVSSPWYAAGLAKGDRILDVQGKPVATGIALLVALDEAFSSSAAEVSMTAERKGELITVRWLTAGRSADDVLEGVQLGDLGVDMRRPPLADGLALGMRQFASYAGLLAETIRGLTSGAIAPSEALQGPVGIASLVRQGWSYGLLVFLQLWALLSLNFGFINLIPFPALDGSRVAFALVEWVRGRPIPPQKEGLVHAIGFAILLGLLVLITFQDVARLLG